MDYLKYVACLRTGNHSLLLLEIFCTTACPDLANILITRIGRSNNNYLLGAEYALSLLVSLRGDGSKRSQPLRPTTTLEHHNKAGMGGQHSYKHPRDSNH